MKDSPTGPVPYYKPHAVGWRHIEPGVPPYIDQNELYIEIFKEGFEIEEDDNAGLLIDVQSDFLLSGVNLAINNVATGQIIEGEEKDHTNKLIVGKLTPGKYELIIYTHEAITNMDPAHGVAISSFDIFLEMSIRAIRISGKGDITNFIEAVTIDSVDYTS